MQCMGRACATVLYLGLAACASGSREPERPPTHSAAPVELDHIWIVVAPGAPERAVLERVGFRLAPGVNQHDGQGTASVTVEFENAFLELLWPDSAVPVEAGPESRSPPFRAAA